MMTKSKIQFRINALNKRKEDGLAEIATLTTEQPILDAKLTELAVEFANAPEDPTMPNM